jgi:hypothetical protein
MALLSSRWEIVASSGCSANAVSGKDVPITTQRRPEDQCFVL